MSYNVKGKPWAYAGAIDVSQCANTKEVMDKAGLNWSVSKCELVGKMPIDFDKTIDEGLDKILEINKEGGFIHGKDVYRVCENAFATYRTDYNIPLGVVKSKYTPVQNVEAFSFFDEAIGKNKAIWQTAGFFGNGERIFVSAKLPDNILVNDDPVENYLVFTNSHDGSSGVKILFTPIRVVCENTLNAAVKGASNYVTYRHTANVHNKISVAQEILGISKIKVKEAQEYYNFLNTIKVTDNDVVRYICEQVLTSEERFNLQNTGHNYKELIYRSFGASQDAKISTRKINIIGDTWDYYQSGIGQKEIAGTAWGAFNAISGYYSNVDNSVGTKRMDSLLYGDKNRKLESAVQNASFISQINI